MARHELTKMAAARRASASRRDGVRLGARFIGALLVTLGAALCVVAIAGVIA
jgi:hypothetical protein